MKHVITINITVEIDVDPHNYENCTTDEERLAVDIANAIDDPFLTIDCGTAVFSVTGVCKNN